MRSIFSHVSGGIRRAPQLVQPDEETPSSSDNRTHTGMADAGVVDLNADLVRLGWCNLDLLNGQILAGLPRNCRLFSQSASLSCKLFDIRRSRSVSLPLQSPASGACIWQLRIRTAGPATGSSSNRPNGEQKQDLGKLAATPLPRWRRTLQVMVYSSQYRNDNVLSSLQALLRGTHLSYSVGRHRVSLGRET